MGVSKVDAFNETLIDLTSDTVTESDLPQGVTAHNAAGEVITGTKIAAQHETSLTIESPGWYRVGEGIRYNPLGFIFSVTKNYNNTDTCMGAVLVTLANRVLNTKITQLYYVTENKDIPQIRIVNEGGADSYNQKFYLEFLYSNSVRNDVGVMLTVIASVPRSFYENHIVMYTPDKIVKDPVLPDENYIATFAFNSLNSGIVADKALFANSAGMDSNGNAIASYYQPINSHMLKEYGAISEDQVETYLNQIYDLPKRGNSFFEAGLVIIVDTSSLKAGDYYISGYRNDLNNGYMKAETYDASGLRTYVRSKIRGTWTNWIQK